MSMYDEKPAAAPSGAAVPETTADGTIIIPDYDAAPAIPADAPPLSGKDAEVSGARPRCSAPFPQRANA